MGKRIPCKANIPDTKLLEVKPKQRMRRISNIISLMLFILAANTVIAQQKAVPDSHTISGSIKEKKGGEILIGASVYLLEQPKSGTVSNSYGFYSISAPAGIYTLVVNFAGYLPDSIKIVLDKNITQSVELIQKGSELQEVIVNSKKKNEHREE